MILASDKTDRQAALDKLLAMQREDITELFRSFGVFLEDVSRFHVFLRNPIGIRFFCTYLLHRNEPNKHKQNKLFLMRLVWTLQDYGRSAGDSPSAGPSLA